MSPFQHNLLKFLDNTAFLRRVHGLQGVLCKIAYVIIFLYRREALPVYMGGLHVEICTF